jgi:hypothetical protein
MGQPYSPSTQSHPAHATPSVRGAGLAAPRGLTRGLQGTQSAGERERSDFMSNICEEKLGAVCRVAQASESVEGAGWNGGSPLGASTTEQGHMKCSSLQSLGEMEDSPKVRAHQC